MKIRASSILSSSILLGGVALWQGCTLSDADESSAVDGGDYSSSEKERSSVTGAPADELTYKGLGGAGASGSELVTGTYTDPRDGEEYGWVQHGHLQWMTSNLRYLGDAGKAYVNPADGSGAYPPFYVVEEPVAGQPLKSHVVDESSLVYKNGRYEYTPPGGSTVEVREISPMQHLVRNYNGSNPAEARATQEILDYGVYYSYMEALGVCPSEGGWKLPEVHFTQQVRYELWCADKQTDLEKSVCYNGWIATCEDAQFANEPECVERAAYARLCERQDGVRGAACVDGIATACADPTYSGLPECAGTPTALDNECDGKSGIDLSVCVNGWVATCDDPTYSNDANCQIQPDYQGICDEGIFEWAINGCLQGWVDYCGSGGSAYQCNTVPSTYWGEWVDLMHALSTREDLESNSPNKPYLFKGIGDSLRSESWQNGINDSLMSFSSSSYFTASWSEAKSEDAAYVHGESTSEYEMAEGYWHNPDPIYLSYIRLSDKTGYDNVSIDVREYDIWSGWAAYPVRCVREAQ